MTRLYGSAQLPKLIFVSILGLLSIEGCFSGEPKAQDQGIVAFPGSAPAPHAASNASASTALTLDTPVERIAADPRGAAVLNKDIPGLLSNPNYPVFKNMNLKTLAALSGGKLDGQTLAQAQTDLAALPKEASLK